MDTKQTVTAFFKLCDGPGAGDISYSLTNEKSPTEIETDLLHHLGQDGRAASPLFHHESEPCTLLRPISDLLTIWHPDEVAGSRFCVHITAHAQDPTDQDLGAEGLDLQMRQTLESGHLVEVKRSEKIQIRLNFRFLDNMPSVCDEWPPKLLQLDPTTRLDAMPNTVRETVNESLFKDATLFEILHLGGQRLSFSPSLACEDRRDNFVDFENSSYNIEMLADLLTTEKGSNEVLDFTIHLGMKQDASIPKGDIHHALTGPAGSRPTRVVVGYLANNDEGPRSAPGYIEIVLLRIPSADSEDTALHMTPTWECNGTMVGDYCVGTEVNFHGQRIHFRPEYTLANSMEALTRVVAQRAAARSSRLPVKPSYCFNDFRPPRTENISLTSSTIHIYVHHISKLSPDFRARAGIPEIDLPSPGTSYFDVSGTADRIEVLRHITSILSARTGTHTAWKLFQNGIMGLWNMQLWVLPQGTEKDKAKLYRFGEGVLGQFLRDGGGTRLYAELHIIERVQD